MDKLNKFNLVISILIHIILIYYILFIKDITFLIPSKSDGVEVSIIPSTYLLKHSNQIKDNSYNPKVTPEPKYDIPDQTNPDIKIKQKNKVINSEVKENKKHKRLSIYNKKHNLIKKNLLIPKEIPKPDLIPEKEIKDKTLTEDKPLTEDKIIKNNPVLSNKSDNYHVVKTPNIPKKLDKEQLSDLISSITTGDVANKEKGVVIGGKITGTSKTDNLISNYSDKVINKVRPYIQLPENISSDDEVLVTVEILPNLTVYDITFIDSNDLKINKNINYNNAVLTAIKKASPFPPLPDGAAYEDYRLLHLTFKP